jgi:2-hydroxychromene-2-carboxylate isomerase
LGVRGLVNGAVKQQYYVKDLQDWARYAGLTIGQPPVFPVNSVKAMRGAFDTYFAKINDPVYKDKLKSNTEELIQRGGFGSPTFFLIGDDMYFGNDRLPLIESMINKFIAKATQAN